MGFLIYMFIKLLIKLVLLEFWLCWAALALTVALIASLTGHQRVASQWMRSLRWHHLF